jgi:hypothetical protein
MVGVATWTQEQDDEVRRLWRKGMSAKEVARAMGVASRNAVIGRLRRLKEPPRDEVEIRRVRDNHPGRKPAPRRQTLNRPAHISADNNPHKGCNVGLLRARANQCREVVGVGKNGLALFCGAGTVHASSCRYHAGINYIPYRRRAAEKQTNIALEIQVGQRRLRAA